ncbi:MAG TPA: hypothetical protein ENN19_15845 [Chloroflexi bacterium]|nr:hypothetical protein [Chloroflexota bacterium]
MDNKHRLMTTALSHAGSSASRHPRESVGAYWLPTAPSDVVWLSCCATPTRRDRRCSTRLMGYRPRGPPQCQNWRGAASG